MDLSFLNVVYLCVQKPATAQRNDKLSCKMFQEFKDADKYYYENYEALRSYKSGLYRIPRIIPKYFHKHILSYKSYFANKRVVFTDDLSK